MDPAPRPAKVQFDRARDTQAGSPLVTRARARANADVPGRAMLAANCLFSIFGLPFVHDRDGMAYLAKPGGDDPTSREQAHLSDHAGWLESEKVEMTNHETNLSWVEINASDKPTNRKIVKLVWVYKIKRNGKLKSRLCVQGCTQIAGIDYHQTFCAAMRSSTLRLLSSAAARLGYGLRRWDFVSAYLQGELLEGEVVYCSLPKGYEEITGRSAIGTDGRPKLVKVVKPIYGMAQAGRRWQRSLFPWLMSKELGFTQSFHDPCVFIKNRKFKDSKGI